MIDRVRSVPGCVVARDGTTARLFPGDHRGRGEGGLSFLSLPFLAGSRRVLRLRRHRPLTRGEGVQVLEIQTDPRRWVQSDAGFPLRIRLDRPNLLLWLLVSGPRLYTGLVYLLLLPGRPNLLLPRSR